jgi:predicted RNase H-like HicB family nuclease
MARPTSAKAAIGRPDEEKGYIPSQIIILAMFAECIKAAIDSATYEIIDDPEPFYGEIPDLRGVWATGKTLESCRDNLLSALEDWIAFRLRTGRSIPAVGGASIMFSAEPVSIVE